MGLALTRERIAHRLKDPMRLRQDPTMRTADRGYNIGHIQWIIHKKSGVIFLRNSNSFQDKKNPQAMPENKMPRYDWPYHLSRRPKKHPGG